MEAKDDVVGKVDEKLYTRLEVSKIQEIPERQKELVEKEDFTKEDVEVKDEKLEEIEPVVVRSSSNSSIGLEKDNRVIDLSSVLNKVALKRDSSEERYIDSYRKYQLGGEMGKVFVLSPKEREEIEKAIHLISSEIVANLPEDYSSSIVTEWKTGSTIFSILSKALVLESIKYSDYIAKFIADSAKESENSNYKICELCVGAGITSSLLYIEGKKINPFKNLQIHAVDNSVESIAAAIAMFEMQEIPYLLLKEGKDLGDVAQDYDGVVLIIKDAVEFLEENTIKYDALISENGVSYFDYEKHKVALQEMIKDTRAGGIIALASLNPRLIVSLDKLFLVGQIIAGGQKNKEYLSRINRGKNPYYVKDDKIKRAMTPEAGGQIDLLNYLLKNDFSNFLSYMKGLLKATKAAEVLIKEIKSPISVSEEILEKEGLSNMSADWNITGAPCDVLITKV